MPDDFPQRVITPETLTRYDAMCAASNWARDAQYTLAEEAVWAVVGTDKNCMRAVARQAIGGITELSPDSAFPGEEEKYWRLRVELHASVMGITYEQADANLREDFKQYLQLLSAIMIVWRLNDLEVCRMPMSEHDVFSEFWCGKCAQSPDSVFTYLEGLHATLCVY